MSRVLQKQSCEQNLNWNKYCGIDAVMKYIRIIIAAVALSVAAAPAL